MDPKIFLCHFRSSCSMFKGVLCLHITMIEVLELEPRDYQSSSQGNISLIFTLRFTLCTNSIFKSHTVTICEKFRRHLWMLLANEHTVNFLPVRVLGMSHCKITTNTSRHFYLTLLYFIRGWTVRNTTTYSQDVTGDATIEVAHVVNASLWSACFLLKVLEHAPRHR